MPRSRLIPEVQALVDSGQLPATDSEWIQNLPRDKQLAAAEKCINIPKILMPPSMFPRTGGKRNDKGPYGGPGDKG